MKPVAEDINRIIKKIFSKQHPFLAEIIINWGKIVGAKYYRNTYPFKILNIKEKGLKLSVLHVQVDNSSLSLEMSYLQEVIMERIAVYLGFRAIHRLRFIVH